MKRSEFVDPADVRIPLQGEDRWIVVRRELNYDEHQEMLANYRTLINGDRLAVDPLKIGRARMAAYIVGWSFRDPQGNPVPVSHAAFGNLRPPIAKEVADALELHEAMWRAEAEAEKNVPDGATVSGPISPSVS